MLEGGGGGEGWWEWWLLAWLLLGSEVVVLGVWGVADVGELGWWTLLTGGDERGELDASLDGLVWVVDDGGGVAGSEASISGLVPSRGRFVVVASSGGGFLLVSHW